MCSVANPSLVGPEANAILGSFLKVKNTHLGINVKLLGFLPGPCKGLVQVKS